MSDDGRIPDAPKSSVPEIHTVFGDSYLFLEFYLADDVANSSLLSDTRFFSMLGSDSVKLSFFRAFNSQMRLASPGFGKGCYVDSTPLPNDMMDNPFDALCCHGISSSEVVIRLMLVIDAESGLPVWYDIIPGNILDISTAQAAVEDIKASLYIDISSFVLDE